MSSEKISSIPAPDNNPEEGDGAQLLVSEFPPPPFYYTRAKELKPPPIPQQAIARGTAKAAAAAARARAEAERIRLTENKNDSFLAGDAPKDEDEDDGSVVAVFGEIVEDPLLVEPLDSCEDPTVVRDQVKRLNQQVLQGFVQLVQDLVHRPVENKKTRDELSHNIFLMLQECNKFREHQARELLIELLEKQLAERQGLLKDFQESVQKADELLK